ncbi:MAG: hypothetical protein FRX49_08934 [Trebouxia sp. A1-2]|nr:MAG: hypothetical protein FRX49_08934 [Trebouxia sp. A1-2]
MQLALPDISELSPQLQQEWHPDNTVLLGGVKHSSLATKAPRQAKYWNHDKNAKTAEQTLAGTNLRAEWKCPNCSHEWQAPVARRVQNDSGCPRCSGKIARRTKQPTFEEAKHQLLLEWDYERNAADGSHPHDITLGSQKLVHWVCHKCPMGQPHLFRMTPNDRTSRKRADPLQKPEPWRLLGNSVSSSSLWLTEQMGNEEELENPGRVIPWER